MKVDKVAWLLGRGALFPEVLEPDVLDARRVLLMQADVAACQRVLRCERICRMTVGKFFNQRGRRDHRLMRTFLRTRLGYAKSSISA